MRISTIVLLATAFILAGCLDAASGPGSGKGVRQGAPGPIVPKPGILAGWSELALPYGVNHVHAEHNHHLNLSTPNFEVLGWNPLITDYHGRSAGGYLCGDAKAKDGRRLSVVHSFTTDIAFVITDVTNASDPKKLGELVMDFTHVYDLAITPDQRFVLLATSPLDTGPEIPGAPAARTVTWRDACTGESHTVLGPEQGLPYASGIVLVDISNPRNPLVQDFRMFPILGGHSVHAADLGGKTLILATIANLPGQASFYVFMDIQATAAGPRLNILSLYQRTPTTADGHVRELTQTNHDGYLHKHPITGDHLAYLAYGDNGLVILNVNDPTRPQFLSHLEPWAGLNVLQPGEPYIHEALPIEGAWDGRHYTFLGDECGGRPQKAPTCLAYAVDTTDPRKPFTVGAWTLPHDVPWSLGLMFSLHYIGVVDRTLFVSVYHAGLWAVDVSALGQGGPMSLPSIGVFMPPWDSPKPAPRAGYSPRVNDLDVFEDGTMAVYDARTGVWMLRFDATNPALPPEPWPMG